MRITEATPAPCALCGAGNTPTNDGQRRRFVDLERDVNWNDPLILCEDCVMKTGALLGMVGPDSLAGERSRIRGLEKALHESKTEMDAMKRRAKKLGMSFTDKAAA